jgi:hypothetical protein
VFLTLPFIANAQTGTLGTEAPEIYCTYSQNGEEVDGNSLTAGTYDVSFYVSGVKNISIIELTVAYDESVTVDSTPTALMSDELSDMKSMGYIIGDGEMVFGFVSQNSDTTSCNDEDVLIVSVQMTFANDCDAENVLTAKTSPNLTFIQADYNDGYDDCYSLDLVAPDYSGNVYVMTCDISPEMGHSVSGSIVVMTDSTGTTLGKSAYGEYILSLYSDEDRTDLVASVTSVYTRSDESISNKFNLTNIKKGTYYAKLESDYSITREDITVMMGDSDITDVKIPVIACDFKVDGTISVNDTRICQTASVDDDEREFCDLNADGVISVNDVRIVQACASDSPSYASLVIG